MGTILSVGFRLPPNPPCNSFANGIAADVLSPNFTVQELKSLLYCTQALELRAVVRGLPGEKSSCFLPYRYIILGSQAAGLGLTAGIFLGG